MGSVLWASYCLGIRVELEVDSELVVGFIKTCSSTVFPGAIVSWLYINGLVSPGYTYV